MGSVVNVDFRVDVVDQSGQGQTHALVGYATADTNWTWTGYLGGLAPGTYTVSAVATSSRNYESAPAVATLIVTKAPDYEPPINRAINQVQVSPGVTNSFYVGFGTTVDDLGHIRVFYETDVSTPTAYMNEYTAEGLPLLTAPVQLPVAGAVVGRDDGLFEQVYISSRSIEVQNFSAAGAALGNPIIAATGIAFGSYSGLEAAADDAGDLLIAYSTGSGDVDALTLSASGTVTRAVVGVLEYEYLSEGEFGRARRVGHGGDCLVRRADAHGLPRHRCRPVERHERPDRQSGFHFLRSGRC